MEKKPNYTRECVLVAIVVAILLWLAFNPLSIERDKTEKLAGTEYTVLEAEETFYGSEEVNVRSGYYLLDAQGDTLSFQWAPYENVNGIVYFMHDGVYDCRDKAPVLIIKQEEELGDVFRLKDVEGEDAVLIRNVKNSKEYIYDLQTGELSSK